MMMHPHDRRPPSRYQHHDPPPPPPPPPNGSNWLSIILRICGLVLAVTCATVMAAPDVCTGYTHFGGFVFVVGTNITASILEAVAIYLHIRLNQAAAAVRDPDIKEEEEGIGPAGIVLLALDIMLVPALLLTAMGAAFTQAAASNDQISACSAFAAQVMRAKILSFFACVVLMLAAFFKIAPFQFNMPPY